MNNGSSTPSTTTTIATLTIWNIAALVSGIIGLQYRLPLYHIVTSCFIKKNKTLVRKEQNQQPDEKPQSSQEAEFLTKHPNGFGRLERLPDITIESSYLLPVPHLADFLTEDAHAHVVNERQLDKVRYNKFMTTDSIILGDVRRTNAMSKSSRAYLRAGPRAELFFRPRQVNAAIVTCGGLCPGLNNVIRDITLSLWNLYGVTTIYGIRGGFHGFYAWQEEDLEEDQPSSCLSEGERERMKPLLLTPESVSGIHHWGGTILMSNRGGFDLERIFAFLQQHDIHQLYIIGGDGTHRAADKIAQEGIRRNMRLSVAGIPKTIDNDVDLLDRSFGFNTAVEEAQRAIRSANTEAKCVPNGIGIVKLMGREAGFIAAHATLSSGDVNLCLVPEIPIILDGPKSCLTHLEQVLEQRGHAVIVVAEGAGEQLLTREEEARDAGGNKKLAAIGEFMKHHVVDHFQSKLKDGVTVKYIDPSYMIRSGPANAADSLYCALLAQNAVHGAMAGYTAFTVGLNCNRMVYLPITAVTKNSPRIMDPFGRTWERVLCLTRQPNTTEFITEPKTNQAFTSDPPL